MANTKDPKLLDRLRAKQKSHLELVRAERVAYYARRSDATCLSMIMDGSSQAEWNLPHFAEASKESAASVKIKTHIVGVLVHSLAAFIYVLTSEWAHGSNLSIEVLHRSLALVETRRDLPEVLHLQMDNCWYLVCESPHCVNECSQLCVFDLLLHVA
jgi:hypothetical protein